MAQDRTVTANWHGGYHCTVTAGDFEVQVDEPAEVGGTDRGPQPTDYFLVSIASCFTLALGHSAKRQGLDPTVIRVRVTGVYDGLRFASVRIDAEVGVPPERLDELVAAAERVCYVTNTLRSGVELATEAVAVGNP